MTLSGTEKATKESARFARTVRSKLEIDPHPEK
jgi:hypothetical protein